MLCLEASTKRATMQLLVQHGKETYQVTCEEDDAIEEVMKKTEAVLGIIQSYQKLIYKGKTLNRKERLAQAKLKDGAKIMLIASSMPIETKVSLYHAAAHVSSKSALVELFGLSCLPTSSYILTAPSQ